MHNFTFIINTNDTMQGVGSMIFEESSKQSTILSIMVSQLTAIHMQLNAKYYLYALKTNWLRGIYAIKHWLPCKESPFLTEEWFQSNGKEPKKKKKKEMIEFEKKEEEVVNTECLHLDLRDYQATINMPRFIYLSKEMRNDYERTNGKLNRHSTRYKDITISWGRTCTGIPPGGR